MFIKIYFFVLLTPLSNSFGQSNHSEEYINLNGYKLKNEKPEWFKCGKAVDCVEIAYSCAGAVVNKKYFEEADKLYQNLSMARDCIPETQKKSKVICDKQKCSKKSDGP